MLINLRKESNTTTGNMENRRNEGKEEDNPTSGRSKDEMQMTPQDNGRNGIESIMKMNTSEKEAYLKYKETKLAEEALEGTKEGQSDQGEEEEIDEAKVLLPDLMRIKKREVKRRKRQL